MMFRLRPAVGTDLPAIRRLIYAVRINPTGLSWQHFILAISPQGKIIGCGQVKQHRDDSRELASIAVEPEYRHQGVATAIIQNLITTYPIPLYLTCRARMELFYERFGFRVISQDDMPPYFQRLTRISNLLSKIRLIPKDLFVMKRE